MMEIEVGVWYLVHINVPAWTLKHYVMDNMPWHMQKPDMSLCTNEPVSLQFSHRRDYFSMFNQARPN